MEYIYAVLLLHSIKKEITEDSIMAVLKASGFKPDKNRVVSLVSLLKTIDIDKVIAEKPVVEMPKEIKEEPKKEEKTETKEITKAEEKAKEEEAMQGLGKLFG